MAVFDLRAAAKVAGTGGDFLSTAATGFGVPNCLLQLTRSVLNALPGGMLNTMMSDLVAGQDAADSVIKSINNFIKNELGITIWDTENGGFLFLSSASKNGYDKNSAGFLNDALGFLNAATSFAGRLYSNYELARDQINGIKECVNSYINYLKYRDGNSANELYKLGDQEYDDYIRDIYGSRMSQMEEAYRFIQAVQDQIDIIDDILAQRANDPSLEPQFNCSAIDILSGTSYALQCQEKPETQKEIFRLVYGPPKSYYGQFILSNDGIYFDSQTSGILPALTYLIGKKAQLDRTQNWRFTQDPSLGGRGDSFSTNDLQLYVNTLLDPTKIDDNFTLRPFYDKDGFLQELINNKSKRIYDLSAQINELEQSSAPESVIINQKQSLISENASLQEKINKRKKQIELAVKLPYAAKYSSEFSYKPGEVPVNDFSYLAGANLSLDLQKQKALSFSQVEIDGFVSPLQLSTTYVVSKGNSRNSSVEHLIISDLGDGAIIYDGSSVSSTNSVILQAESFITTDSIIAMYNFLETNLEQPSSTSFTVRNAISPTTEKYAQLVGNSQDEIFKNGLGIPLLKGITRHSSTSPASVSGLGSYVKLPNIKEFNDLLYSKNGATIDFWVHMPNLNCVSGGYDEGPVSSLFRLVLSNENTGFEGTAPSNPEAQINNFGTQPVRGLMMGFTRDVRLTSEQAATLTGNPVSSSVFFIAPTQSTSVSSVSFINRSSYDSDICSNSFKYHSMVQKVNEKSNNLYLSSCNNEFCHIAVTFDRMEDQIRFYMDGSLLTVSSMSNVFGITPYTMPNLPTFKKPNSFKYTSSSLNSDAPASLKSGPTLDRYFTPWIVGGGYTDGMYQYGNFLGGQYGGIKSGLNGYLGSLKFYSKALSDAEVFENYRAQRGFFKNIDIPALAFTPCSS